MQLWADVVAVNVIRPKFSSSSGNSSSQKLLRLFLWLWLELFNGKPLRIFSWEITTVRCNHAQFVFQHLRCCLKCTLQKTDQVCCYSFSLQSHQGAKKGWSGTTFSWVCTNISINRKDVSNTGGWHQIKNPPWAWVTLRCFVRIGIGQEKQAWGGHGGQDGISMLLLDYTMATENISFWLAVRCPLTSGHQGMLSSG